jgi:photosystem I P700 chlorophyll a apoprotein A1
MTISSPEREAKKVKIAVDRNPVETSFEKWAKPGHFSRTLSKGPNTTTWIWNLQSDSLDLTNYCIGKSPASPDVRNPRGSR